MSILQDVIRIFPVQYDEIDCCVVLADREGRIIVVNPAFCRTVGYSAAELPGRLLSEVLHGPLSSVEERQRVQDAMAEGRPFTIENVNYWKDRTTFWVHVDATPIRDPQTGEVEGFLGISRNIERRNIAEEKLLEAEKEKARLQKILFEIIEITPTSIAVYDQNMRLVFFNSAWRTARPLAAPFLRKGMTFEDVLRVSIKAGQYAPDLPADASPEQVEAFLKTSIEHFNSHNMSRVIKLGENKSWEAHCLKTEAGYTIISSNDISEQMVQIDVLQQIIDTVPSGIAVYDKNKKLMMVNKTWREQRPILSPHVHHGMTLAEILKPNLDSASGNRVSDQYDSARTSGVCTTGETAGVGRGGQVVWFVSSRMCGGRATPAA